MKKYFIIPKGSVSFPVVAIHPYNGDGRYLLDLNQHETKHEWVIEEENIIRKFELCDLTSHGDIDADGLYRHWFSTDSSRRIAIRFPDDGVKRMVLHENVEREVWGFFILEKDLTA